MLVRMHDVVFLIILADSIIAGIKNPNKVLFVVEHGARLLHKRMQGAPCGIKQRVTDK